MQEDQEKAKELMEAATLVSSGAHFSSGICYSDGGDLKKAKFHFKFVAIRASWRVFLEIWNVLSSIA